MTANYRCDTITNSSL